MYATQVETALVVAIIAAAASLVSAFVSWRSAKSSSLSARQALSVNHQVAAIDRDADELRTAFQLVAEKMSVYGEGPASMTWVGGVIGALESLIACRAADVKVEERALALQNQIIANYKLRGKIRTEASEPVGNASLKDVRAAYKGCQEALEAKRQSILAGS